MAEARQDASGSFEFLSVVRGYHVYKDIWSPEINEILQCRRDPTNDMDKNCVAILKNDIVVGHVPREHAKVFSFFIKRGGQITVKITGDKQNKGVGLEIPSLYIFTGVKKDTVALPSLLKLK